MTDCIEIRDTTKLLYFLVSIKEKEIRYYEEKVLKFKELMAKDPNNLVNENKYILAKTRHNQLTKTTKGLQRLGQKITNL